MMACTACVLLGACSDDSKDYESKLPIFSDVVFDTETIYTDSYVTATAVQKKQGKLLNTAIYFWKLNDLTANETLQWNSTVLYTQNATNPSCKFRTPDVPGTYILTFQGQYSISGQAGNSSTMGEIPKGTVKYEYTPIKAYVTITKSFRVVSRPNN